MLKPGDLVRFNNRYRKFLGFFGGAWKRDIMRIVSVEPSESWFRGKKQYNRIVTLDVPEADGSPLTMNAKWLSFHSRPNKGLKSATQCRCRILTRNLLGLS